MPSATSAQRNRVESEIRQELQRQPTASRLSTALGILYESQSRFDEAIAAYGRALQLDPNDVIAANNLALLMAYKGKAEQAVPLIERAIKISGPVAALLDSRGTVELRTGEFKSALDDFVAAVADQPAASRWYHVALAQLRQRHKDDAKQAYEQAVALGFNAEQLHVLERPEYTQLVNQLVP